MPESPVSATHPKPAPSPYAALNGARDDQMQAAPLAADPETARLAAETDRLAALKRALWESFQVAPQSPVRAPIVDVTMAYTDALRLELRLRAAGKKPAVAPRLAPKTGFRTD